MKRRILAALVAMLLVIGMVPGTTLALNSATFDPDGGEYSGSAPEIIEHDGGNTGINTTRSRRLHRPKKQK